MNTLAQFVEFLILEGSNDLKSMYGSNFQYNLAQYTVADGLATHGVHFSDYDNAAIYPQSRYYPRGLYFYFLTKNCDAAIGHGFATDRKWANIVKINNERMAIINPGNPMDFSAADLQRCLRKLKSMFRLSVKVPSEGTRVPERGATPFYSLFQAISFYESKGKGSFNKILHLLGYDGIIDYAGMILPIERCQGIMTWPGGVELVQSIPTNPQKNPNDDLGRLKKIILGLSKRRNGTLQLTRKEISQAFKQLPKFSHEWDVKDSQMSLAQELIEKLDFNYQDAWDWIKWSENAIFYFYIQFASNPTTPKEFWELYVDASDEDLRRVARKMLNKS